MLYIRFSAIPILPKLSDVVYIIMCNLQKKMAIQYGIRPTLKIRDVAATLVFKGPSSQMQHKFVCGIGFDESMQQILMFHSEYIRSVCIEIRTMNHQPLHDLALIMEVNGHPYTLYDQRLASSKHFMHRDRAHSIRTQSTTTASAIDTQSATTASAMDYKVNDTTKVYVRNQPPLHSTK
eukprot:42824_1